MEVMMSAWFEYTWMGTDAEENKGVSVCYNVMSYTDDLLKLRSDQIGVFLFPKQRSGCSDPKFSSYQQVGPFSVVLSYYIL